MTSLLGSGRPIASDELRTPRTNHLFDRSPSMRSDKIHRALAQGMNRFEVCQLVAKGVKATHKTGRALKIRSTMCCSISAPTTHPGKAFTPPHRK